MGQNTVILQKNQNDIKKESERVSDQKTKHRFFVQKKKMMTYLIYLV